jgi:hypothetical protein
LVQLIGHEAQRIRTGRSINPTEFWNNLAPGKDDPGQPAFLDQSKRAAEIMSGLDKNMSPVSDVPFGRKGPFDIPFTTVTDLPPGNPRFVPGGTVPLERFRAKWIPVRVKKTRQNKKLELRF